MTQQYVPGREVLLCGSTGQLGQSLLRTLPQELSDAISVTRLTRQELDIVSLYSHRDFLSTDELYELLDSLWNPHSGSWIVNASAYTDVVAAEDPVNRREVDALNTWFPGVLAGYAQARGHHLIHISTDYVFPGKHILPELKDQTEEYSISDPTGALNEYGRSKAAGEELVLECSQCIIRTSWLYTGNFLPEHKDFVTTMTGLAHQAKSPDVVADQFARPTYAPDLAQALWRIILTGHVPGLLHFSDSGEVASWYDLARAVFSRVAPGVEVHAVSTHEHPSSVARPEFTALSLDSWTRAGFLAPRAWHEALGAALEGRL